MMAQPATNGAKCRLIPFPYHYGMLLEPIDYLVLLIAPAESFTSLWLVWGCCSCTATPSRKCRREHSRSRKRRALPG
jgi:hypothetical protein